MADAWFTQVLYSIQLKKLGFYTGDIYVMLVADTFDLGLLSTARKITELVVYSHEVSGVGYTEGGLSIVASATGYSPVGDGSYELAAATNPQWPNSTITARYGVVYASAVDALLYLIDFGENISSSNSTFTIPLSQTTPLFTVNTTPGYMTESTFNQAYKLASSPYSDSSVYFYLVDSAYVPDLADGIFSSVQDHIVGSITFASTSHAIEGDSLVFRVASDVLTIYSVTGDFRYLLATEYDFYSWITVKDFGTDQTAAGENVVIDLPNGYHKLQLLP